MNTKDFDDLARAANVKADSSLIELLTRTISLLEKQMQEQAETIKILLGMVTQKNDKETAVKKANAERVAVYREKQKEVQVHTTDVTSTVPTHVAVTVPKSTPDIQVRESPNSQQIQKNRLRDIEYRRRKRFGCDRKTCKECDAERCTPPKSDEN